MHVSRLLFSHGNLLKGQGKVKKEISTMRKGKDKMKKETSTVQRHLKKKDVSY